MWNTFWDGRGVPWQFDPGPPASSDYAALCAQTPNYLGIGHAVLGSGGFRWRRGPVLHRRRLVQNKVPRARDWAGGRAGRGARVRRRFGRACRISSSSSVSSSIDLWPSTARSCTTLTRLVRVIAPYAGSKRVGAQG